MEDDFYKKALNWYNTIYLNPASERLIYFIVSIILCFCIYFALSDISFIRNNKMYKRSYVMIMEHKNPEEELIAKKMQDTNDRFTGLYRIVLEKYVTNFEELQYKEATDGMLAVKRKTTIIKNLSSIDVYNDYIKHSSQDADGDISYAILNIKKTITIYKIEFINEYSNIFERMYDFLSLRSPRIAKVYFSTETTNEMNKQQYYVADITFNLNIIQHNKKSSSVEFKVNSYNKRKIDKPSFLIDNEDDRNNRKNKR